MDHTKVRDLVVDDRSLDGFRVKRRVSTEMAVRHFQNRLRSGLKARFNSTALNSTLETARALTETVLLVSGGLASHTVESTLVR
jgi:hypothetical protein